MIQLSGLARFLHFGKYGPGPGGAGVGKKEEERGHRGDFSNLHAFGLLDRTCRPDLLFAGDV